MAPLRRLAANRRGLAGLARVVASPGFGVGSASTAAAWRKAGSGGGTALAERCDARAAPLGKTFRRISVSGQRAGKLPGRLSDHQGVIAKEGLRGDGAIAKMGRTEPGVARRSRAGRGAGRRSAAAGGCRLGGGTKALAARLPAAGYPGAGPD